MTKPDDTIWVETLVSHRSGEPLVQIAWHDHIGQLTTQQARQLALQLLEAADAAVSDAFLVAFVRDQIKAPTEAQAGILKAFRVYREEQGR